MKERGPIRSLEGGFHRSRAGTPRRTKVAREAERPLGRNHTERGGFHICSHSIVGVSFKDDWENLWLYKTALTEVAERG